MKTGKSCKAQVAAEYLAISAFLLAAVVIFFAYSSMSYNDSVSYSKSKNVVDSLANTASQLAGLGNGSSLTITLDFPEDVNGFSVSGKNLSLFLNSGTGLSEYYAVSKLDLNSISLSTHSGFHTVKAVLNNGKVNFSEVS